MYWERWFEWVAYLEVGEVEPTVVEWELMRDEESKMAMSRGSYLANETSKAHAGVGSGLRRQAGGSGG